MVGLLAALNHSIISRSHNWAQLSPHSLVTQNATVLSLYLLLFQPSLVSTAVLQYCLVPDLVSRKQSHDHLQRLQQGDGDKVREAR